MVNDQSGFSVAGVEAPAFVERLGARLMRSWSRRRGVAGVEAPAFVERIRDDDEAVAWFDKCRRG